MNVDFASQATWYDSRKDAKTQRKAQRIFIHLLRWTVNVECRQGMLNVEVRGFELRLSVDVGIVQFTSEDRWASTSSATVAWISLWYNALFNIDCRTPNIECRSLLMTDDSPRDAGTDLTILPSLRSSALMPNAQCPIPILRRIQTYNLVYTTSVHPGTWNPAP